MAIGTKIRLQLEAVCIFTYSGVKSGKEPPRLFLALSALVQNMLVFFVLYDMAFASSRRLVHLFLSFSTYEMGGIQPLLQSCMEET